MEVDDIELENRKLSEELICCGFTREEVESIVDDALRAI